MKALPQSSTQTFEAINNRTIATLRLILAASGLLVILIDPPQSRQLAASIYVALSLYLVYGAYVYSVALRRRLPQLLYRWGHWIDLAWYLGLIVLGQATGSIFFIGIFLAILVASFQWGFREGISVTLVAAVLFTLVGLAGQVGQPGFELNRLLLRPVYLVVLGYMIAYWGGHELTLKRRLALLKEIAVLSNPRFGVDYTLGMLVDRLCLFYNADVCMLMLPDEAGKYRLYRAGGESAAATHGEEVPADMAQMLLALPEGHAAIFNTGSAPWTSVYRKSQWKVFNTATRAHSPAVNGQVGHSIAGVLGVRSLVSVPFNTAGDAQGRLYVGSRRTVFDEEDAGFLVQVTEHIMPVIQNIRLVDRLASDAAEEERMRIARDLHDSMIQPYIGLQMGLAAVRSKAASGNANVGVDIDRLYRLSGDVVADLRGYVRGLSGGGEAEGSLLPAVRRFTGKFTDATGINVNVETSGDMRVNDRLAAELFQMVAEGLSNIRKHTHASQATVALKRHDHQFSLLVANDNANDAPAGPFVPRSITQRAEALGGNTRVERQQNGNISVIVDIPL